MIMTGVYAFRPPNVPSFHQLTSLRPLLRNVLSDQAPFSLRKRNIAFALVGAAAISEKLDSTIRLEAVAAGLVDRIARDPKLIASHACITAAALDVAAHCALLLRDLGDARALGRAHCDSAFIVDVAPPIAEIFDGLWCFETKAVIFIRLVALDP